MVVVVVVGGAVDIEMEKRRGEKLNGFFLRCFLKVQRKK